MKTIIYVDGYNLFYGCLKHSGDKWLDLKVLLADQILHAQNPHAELVKIKFFTADIKSRVASNGAAAQHAQQAYHRALSVRYPDEIDIIKGYYSLEKARLLKFKQPPDKTERVDVWRLEEKQTDVNIALEAYRDASKGLAKQLVFVSNDTDLAPALKAIRDDFGASLILGTVIPVRGSGSGRPPNKQLSQYCDWTRSHITDIELRGSHLPEVVATGKKPVVKPGYW
ncbi:MAG: NYN domain-containing protein [Pseudomonadota bacterium]|nr:NYN domain-containing protein [Pseudomonadota bacterium]MEE3320973.1 NYN domain-containing protein [Pseudomonadota bacterium]